VEILIDSQPFDVSKSFVYKGLMLSDVTSLFLLGIPMLLGLKSDLTSEYISRALHYLDKKNYKAMQARVIETNLQPVPPLNLNSGYITRATKLYLVKAIKHPGACIKIIS
jgi:hypothetical protein